MSIRRLLTQRVTHLRKYEASQDSQGNPVYAEASEHCRGLLQQFAQREAVASSPQQARGRLFVDGRREIGPEDAFVVNGQRWEIDGLPRRDWHPRLKRYVLWDITVVGDSG